MIVNGIASGACLFCLRRHLADIAVIIIHPHQGNILGNFQTCVVTVEHLLIRNENLRNLGGVANTVGQQLTLISDNLGQGSYTLGCTIVAVDTGIVYASHTKSIDGILTPALPYPNSPVAFNHLLIGMPDPVVIIMTAKLVTVPAPFVLIVTQHLLAVAGAHIDVILHDKGDIGLLEPESTATRMHGRP